MGGDAPYPLARLDMAALAHDTDAAGTEGAPELVVADNLLDLGRAKGEPRAPLLADFGLLDRALVAPEIRRRAVRLHAVDWGRGITNARRRARREGEENGDEKGARRRGEGREEKARRRAG